MEQFAKAIDKDMNRLRTEMGELMKIVQIQNTEIIDLKMRMSKAEAQAAASRYANEEKNDVTDPWLWLLPLFGPSSPIHTAKEFEEKEPPSLDKLLEMFGFDSKICIPLLGRLSSALYSSSSENFAKRF